MTPKDDQVLILETVNMLRYMAKGTSQMYLGLWTFKKEDFHGLSRWAHCNHTSP